MSDAPSNLGRMDIILIVEPSRRAGCARACTASGRRGRGNLRPSAARDQPVGLPPRGVAAAVRRPSGRSSGSARAPASAGCRRPEVAGRTRRPASCVPRRAVQGGAACQDRADDNLIASPPGAVHKHPPTRMRPGQGVARTPAHTCRRSRMATDGNPKWHRRGSGACCTDVDQSSEAHASALWRVRAAGAAAACSSGRHGRFCLAAAPRRARGQWCERTSSSRAP